MNIGLETTSSHSNLRGLACWFTYIPKWMLPFELLFMVELTLPKNNFLSTLSMPNQSKMFFCSKSFVRNSIHLLFDIIKQFTSEIKKKKSLLFIYIYHFFGFLNLGIREFFHVIFCQVVIFVTVFLTDSFFVYCTFFFHEQFFTELSK